MFNEIHGWPWVLHGNAFHQLVSYDGDVSEAILLGNKNRSRTRAWGEHFIDLLRRSHRGGGPTPSQTNLPLDLYASRQLLPTKLYKARQMNFLFSSRTMAWLPNSLVALLPGPMASLPNNQIA